MRHADTNGYSNSYANGDANADSYTNLNGDANTYSYANANPDADGSRYGHPDAYLRAGRCTWAVDGGCGVSHLGVRRGRG